MFLSSGVPPVGSFRIRTKGTGKHEALRNALIKNLRAMDEQPIFRKLAVIVPESDSMDVDQAGDNNQPLPATPRIARETVLVGGPKSIKELVEKRGEITAQQAYLSGTGFNDALLTPTAAYFDVDEDTFRQMSIDTLAKDDVKKGYRRRVKLEWKATKLVDRFLNLVHPSWFPSTWTGWANQPLSLLKIVSPARPIPRSCSAFAPPNNMQDIMDWLGQVYLRVDKGTGGRVEEVEEPFGVNEVERHISALERTQRWFVISIWTSSSHYHGVFWDREWYCILDG